MGFIQSHISRFNLWKSVTFWEEYFWAEVASKFKEAGKDGNEVDSDSFMSSVVPTVISAFAHDMLVTWRLSKEMVSEFVSSMCSANQLSPEKEQALKKMLDAFCKQA